ncbi:MAG: response regulator [Microscillaceae bacterium]|jgi:DNA-binding LytR/AlgR family response regulator|nr:response regulator [Microscillaceae bacterium]
MRILVAEDDPIFADNLTILIDELNYQLIGVVDNSEEFLRTYLATQPDLVLLDIHIRGVMDGIQIAEKINATENPTPVIFITALQDYATFERAKKANPFAYITKPFDEATLQRSIELALYKYANLTADSRHFEGWKNDILVRNSFFIKINQKIYKVELSEIAYLEVNEKYTKFVTAQAHYQVKMSLNQIIEKLPPSDFIRIHRNYIINANFIKQIDLQSNELNILNQTIPLGKQYRSLLLNRVNLI